MPSSVLQVRFQDAALSPALSVLCAGFELGDWRAQSLTDDLFQRHLTSFALSYSEHDAITGATAARSLKRAAEVVYATNKYRRRGEFGELILHAALVDFFGATPAVSKIYYKDSDNDTVKGFDSVHLVAASDSVEIWLGEAKFYKDLNSAIDEAAKSISDHLTRDFLRREFVAITNKLDSNWPHAVEFADALDEATSLDDIAKTIVIPVLITYESEASAAAVAHDSDYIAAIELEAREAWSRFARKDLGTKLTVTLQLILLPMQSKERLLNLMHQKLNLYKHL
ncbi:DUF1837 domain-containing protein [Cryobacterium zongtaii]|uniref:DUF1837 domain-containing protein n=1 Tax=Cryobacterium zongtaii TaxID=1259217 RepID=A0A2S3ZAL6_9MICO|nr:DUF1837 domain-containing protein [Cryobacterium zongtaii]POH62594.1 DUF1837 domain-containing protein [Cryobacterium zongtaii]